MLGHVALGCPWHCGVCLMEDFKCQAGNSEDGEQQERKKKNHYVVLGTDEKRQKHTLGTVLCRART